eukprot:3801178-Karenia_brevis.AAC.1
MEKTYAASSFLHPDFSRHGSMKLPRLMKALRGWTKLNPGYTRPPIPLTFVTLVVGEMIKMDKQAGLVA